MKIKEDLSGLLNLVGDAVQATGTGCRQEFLDSLSNAFRGVIVDLYETDELGRYSVSYPPDNDDPLQTVVSRTVRQSLYLFIEILNVVHKLNLMSNIPL